MSDEKRIALSDLVHSEGFKYLKGAAIDIAGAKLTLAMIANATGTVEAIGVETVRALARRAAVDELLAWPEKEIAKLDKAEQKATP